MPDQVIQIPEIAIGRMTVRIRGVTPLICHRFGERAEGSITKKQQRKAKTGKPARDPDAEFRDALYMISGNGNGDLSKCKFGFPAAGLKKSMVCAGGRFTGEHMTALRGALNIPGDLLDIESPNPPRMRCDRVKLSRVMSLAYRPEFWPWEISAPIHFNRAVIEVDGVLNLLRLAGFSVGIGDWRPEHNGTFGQFELTDELEVMKP